MSDPPSGSPEETDPILEALRSSDPEARKRLFEQLYEELKAIASNRLRASGQSLHTTELVHEAYLKLVDARSASYADRTHFCAVAARAMRQILIDRARSKKRRKRGGEDIPLRLSESDVVLLDGEVDILELDEALCELAKYDEKLARIVELRSFGGLSIDEIATVLDVSPRTVDSRWRLARAWLRKFLSPPSQGPQSPP